VQIRLSRRAQAVLDLAHELARREPGYDPHSGHVLIALTREGGPVIDDTLQRLGIGYEDVLAAVSSAGDVPDAKSEMAVLLSGARRITEESGQVYTAALTLMSALVDDPQCAAARALTSLGASRESLRRLLGEYRDMLVPLLALPGPQPAIDRVRAAGISVRRARAWESPRLASFIEGEGFSPTWAPESANAFSRQPIAVFVAERGRDLVGFAAYNCGLRGIFGPTGVAQQERAGGVASALLLRTLADMRAVGYAYAIIGAVGPAEFYEQVCGAVLLPSAWPSYVTWQE
jgi:hypothetical protein